MFPEDLLGQAAALTVRRFASPGAFLAPCAVPSDNEATVLLLGSEVPKATKEGDSLHVFVYQDSLGRPLATLKMPRVALGEVAFLTVTACTDFGAFVDRGLPKELFVPFAEQTADLRVGDRHPFGVRIDRVGRLAGTMRISEILGSTAPAFELDDWVDGEGLRRDPDIGLFVIVGRRHVGLLPAEEPNNLSRGQAARFRVTTVLPDGRIELSLRKHAHEELDADAGRVLEALARPGAPNVGDRSSPEQIRSLFGLSKKAFKRAIGRLLKSRAIAIDEAGFVKPRR